ncbi:plasmid stabilization protein [Streptomyces sp. NBC_00539]|uniref:plasmid stabilization protein n=1 Tax=Streptomyces sp. NBC_00539 TaxID=2975770 RepID=UPI002E7FE895|nr:plasmid stabilization protein [Streptomyces sp. NBC_00539]WUC63246.1 plasmid stabilization protein [Streptomyces sp. NBC_00539]
MPRGSSGKRERQYEHIKESGQERGMSEGRAKEMAGRTVNKERARSGETKSSSRSSSGSGRSMGSGSGSSGPTRDALYEEAKKRGIEGRSAMNKDQLKKALGR